MNGNQTSTKPGISLYRTIRAGLIIKGKTLTQWCNENGVSRQWVYQAATGIRTGGSARKILKKLLEFVEEKQQ